MSPIRNSGAPSAAQLAISRFICARDGTWFGTNVRPSYVQSSRLRAKYGFAAIAGQL